MDMVIVDDLESSGLELTSDFKAVFPKAKIGLLTISPELQEPAKELGLEFILKPVTADKLQPAFLMKGEHFDKFNLKKIGFQEVLRFHLSSWNLITIA